MPFERELDVARAAAREAAALALEHQRRGLVVEEKADLSPVTAADRACEALIVARLSAAFPGDGLLGEEGAQRPSTTGRRWIIDPIDGTRDFLRGIPLWGVLIGLEEGEDNPVAGVAHLGGLGQTYEAARGQGAYRDGQRIRVSAITSPAAAVLCMNGLGALERSPVGARSVAWMSQFWHVHAMGGCVDAMLVAGGQAEVWIEPSCSPWDLAPVKVILEEAGARCFDFQGRPTIYSGTYAACTPALEGPVRELLGLA